MAKTATLSICIDPESKSQAEKLFARISIAPKFPTTRPPLPWRK